MNSKILLFLVVSFLFIFLISFVSALNSINVTYNFNSTYRGINSVNATACARYSGSLTNPSGFPPTCDEATIDFTSNNAITTLDSNGYSSITSYDGNKYHYFVFNLTNILANDIINMNYFYRVSGDIYSHTRVLSYNFSSSSWKVFTDIENNGNWKNHSFSANNNFINNNKVYIIATHEHYQSTSQVITTDYIQLEITYSTIPNINLSLPSNNTNSSTSLNYFSANFSDSYGLQNATLYVWNSTNSSFTNSTTITGTTNSSNLSLSLNDGNYTWNYLVFNAMNNSNWSTNNYTLTIDTTPPAISITTPTNGTNSTNVNLNINYTSSDLHLSSCWYSNDTYSSNTSITCGTNITGVTWSQGNHNLTIWENDTFGNINSSSVSFLIDNIAPTLTIVHPAIGSDSFSTGTIDLNYTVSDSGVGLSSCWYKNNTGSNITIACGTNTTISQGGDGTYTIYMWANDTLNNVASAYKTWTVSSNAPAVNLNYPSNNYWFNNGTNIYFNYTSTDSNGLSECQLWSNWTGTWSKNYTWLNPNSGIMNFTILNLTDGYYKWNVWCNDTTGLPSTSSWATENITFGIDTIKPNLILSSPLNQTYITNQLTINYSASDLNRDSCWYNINNTQNITLTSCNNISLIANQGSSILRLFVNDSASNVNQTNVTFFVDSINPSIILNTSFSNGSYLNYNNITFNITVVDTNINSCWYNYNGTNQFFTCGNNVSLNLSDNAYTINFYDNDTLNNLNQTNISFTVDTINPQISNIVEATTPGNQFFTFTYSVSDLNLNICKYSFNNGLTNLSITNCNTSVSATIPSLDTSYNLTVYANDLAGNENLTYKTIIISSSIPGPTDGGGGGGGGGNNTISTIAITQINTTERSVLERSIIYSRIFEICNNKTSCILNEIQLNNLKDTLSSQNVLISIGEIKLWLKAYNDNLLEQVQVSQSDLTNYNLSTSILNIASTGLRLNPSKIDSFALVLFSKEFNYQVTTNKVISNFSKTSGDLELSIEKVSDTVFNIKFKVKNMDFQAKNFQAVFNLIDVDGNSQFLTANIRTLNLLNSLFLLEMGGIFGFGILIFAFRNKIKKGAKNVFRKKR